MSDSVLPEKLEDILRALRHRLVTTLGHRLAHIVIYGSHARGDARPDSDIDVLIVVHGAVEYPELMRLTSAIVADLSLQHDVVVSRTFASVAQWENARTPFLINVHREGIVI